MDEGSSKRGLSGLLSKENIKTFFIINAGVFLLSLGVYFFKFPNNFTTGGVSGQIGRASCRERV